MKLKVGIVGHSRRMKKINGVAKSNFKNIEMVPLLIDQIPVKSEFIAFIRSYEKLLDGIIFTGHVPYDILINEIIPKIPWDYIHRDHSQLVRSLLRASLVEKLDIHSISIDSYSEEKVLEIYEEIGLTGDTHNVMVADQHLYDLKYFQYLKDFHKNNYINNGVSCCITGLSNVYSYLLENNIPCISLDPTTDVIEQTLSRFSLKNQAKINENTQLVVLSIEIDILNDYALINENEYKLMVEKSKVSEEIYIFAQKLQGAVVELGRRGYMIFCTKSILETETKNLNELNLLKVVSENTQRTISVGIGYGLTARDAKYSANKGMQKSKRNGGNQAYAAYKGKIFRGPITASDNTPDEIAYKIDECYTKIAAETNLSVNTIFKLQCIINQNKKNCFTPRELAEDFGVTLRSINRIIEKLQDKGYSQVVGKRVVSNAGRPSRIIELLF